MTLIPLRPCCLSIWNKQIVIDTEQFKRNAHMITEYKMFIHICCNILISSCACRWNRVTTNGFVLFDDILQTLLVLLAADDPFCDPLAEPFIIISSSSKNIFIVIVMRLFFSSTLFLLSSLPSRKKMFIAFLSFLSMHDRTDR
ncbi:hypothetical protein DERP_013576 [Dermatophagoides pteronyssinus]|uniref:Uncharacterized protein n=1 Tax=Dermatophagoides pteronyssinus TaxID=6956 RepID=A0ABQ8J5J5_DERPT|nr:hypothetical protein DERP_013576 [Dermatophagoides pteronyssinus]